MKALILGARSLALMAMLFLIPSCDLEDLTGQDDDKDTDSDNLITGSIPSKFQGSWYNESGTYLYEIGTFESEHFIATGNTDYWYEGYTLSNDIYTVEGTSDGGANKSFYLKESESSDGIEVSQVSATSGFSIVTDTPTTPVSFPTANFSASKQTIEEGSTVTFTNTSTEGDTYLWTFEGGSPSTSTSENQTVTYSAAGKYDVTLKVTNSAGSDTETKTDHITVESTAVMRGFAYCGSPTTASYTASTLYAYNSEGGAITVTRSNTGSYAVKFAGMAMTNGQVQASLYGASEGAVRVLTWNNSGNDLVADVRTFDNGANLADRAFTIFLTGKGFEGAYLYADQESAGNYTPNTGKSYNSSGGSPSISSPTTGTYTVTIPGVGAGNLGNVQVTAAGVVSAIAKIKEWSVVGNDLKVEVRTYHSGTGALKDAEFNLLYTKNLNGTTGGYCWADLETSTSTYTPYRNSNSSTGNLTAKKLGTGYYEVLVPNQAGTGNTILVTAYGNNNNKAIISSWGDSGTSLVAYVRTYNSGGTLTDAEFSFYTLYKD